MGGGPQTTGTPPATKMASIATLTSKWEITQLSNAKDSFTQTELEWRPVSSVPTSVHVELLKRNEIPDPYKGLKEWDVQWVGEADWRFKTAFTVSKEDLSQDHIDLVFDGLDTFCKVELDGKEILSAKNMFTAYRVPIKCLLHSGSGPSEHTLVLTFPSTYLEAHAIEKQQMALGLPENTNPKTGQKNSPLIAWNGIPSRLYVRKSQYGWGWDWGPVLMTVGPWKPITVQAYSTRITSSRISVTLPSTSTPSLKATFACSDALPESSITATLLSSTGTVIRTAKDLSLSKEASGEFAWDFKEGEVDLWWPATHGKQPLYTLKLEMILDGNVVAEREDKFGFRVVKVVQEPLVDAEGTSFCFEVNGRRIFCGGSNWIPADSFLTNMTPERYRAWLELVRDGNQNMVRVWGGGVYEDDSFYSACDELGLLVWQDFMFGCGQYPAYPELLESVEEEARQQVERLRNHACMAIFIGNNEDYMVADQAGFNIDYSDTTSDYRKSNFPARHIYERILPKAVNSLSDIAYHPGSPFGGKTDSNDPTVGDIHQWNVWHGTQEPWHNWDKLSGRFVSEFGMEGYPDIRTVDFWLDGNKAERFPQSRTNVNHNKADGFERRLELYLMENFRHAFDMESYVYYTQVMQAETLAAAYRLWRRNWKGHGREYTAGALVWQINDCWPVTSWALVDYFLRPKPAFFAVARELRPVSVGMARKDVKTFADDTTAANFKIEQTLEIWGNNSSFSPIEVTLEVTAFELDGSFRETTKTKHTLAENSSTELFKGVVPGQPTRTLASQLPKCIVIGARLLDSNGTVLARYANWPEPWKYIVFPDPKLKITVAEDGESVTLSCEQPIKGIVLDVKDRTTDEEMGEVRWSDQAVDLMPGDDQVVVAKGLKGREVKARYLGDGSADPN